MSSLRFISLKYFLRNRQSDCEWKWLEFSSGYSGKYELCVCQNEYTRDASVEWMQIILHFLLIRFVVFFFRWVFSYRTRWDNVDVKAAACTTHFTIPNPMSKAVEQKAITIIELAIVSCQFEMKGVSLLPTVKVQAFEMQMQMFLFIWILIDSWWLKQRTSPPRNKEHRLRQTLAMYAMALFRWIQCIPNESNTFVSKI